MNVAGLAGLGMFAVAGLVLLMLLADAMRTPGGIRRLSVAVIAVGVIVCLGSGTAWPGGVMLAGLEVLRMLDGRRHAA